MKKKTYITTKTNGCNEGPLIFEQNIKWKVICLL